MKISDNLRELRKQHGLSQEELAARLEVSRQSVSKWENGSASPELDKLMQICELFHCTMDELLQGTIRETCGLDRATYEKENHTETILTCFGIEFIMIGLSIQAILAEYVMMQEEPANILFLMFVLAAVVCFVLAGMKASFFEKRYPQIPQGLYSETEIVAFEQRYMIAITAGVAVILFAVILQLSIEHIGNEDIANALFLFTVGIGVCIITYYSMQKSMYEKTQVYMQKKMNEWEEQYALYSGIIMVISTGVFLILGFVGHAWEYSWLAFAIGGLCCIICYLFMRTRHMTKRRKQNDDRNDV